MKKLAASAIALIMVAACGPTGGGAGGAGSGQGIWATGSSTVFPFATRVAENFARNTGGTAPRVESQGTGGGINAFCGGVGAGTPDIATASRPMKASEFDACAANGVTQILEIQIGSDGIVIATARDGADFDFRPQDIYMALAAQVPTGSGVGANPNTAWNQVNPALPAQAITVYGPPPTSGTRDAFLELAMTPGAEALPSLAALSESDEDQFETIAHTLREDGRWIDSGENDNVIVQTLTRTPGALGVFGYSFLEENLTQVKAASINGVQPNADTIADGSYPLSRSLFIYVKIPHLDTTAGLTQFLEEFLSDAAAGRGGYLQDRGLIPLSGEALNEQRERLRARTPMVRPAS
ncbi:substrate-binding domain-containing protein [Brevundimonas sp.]|uniref:substrate-binding domain-containing protein n=1 Tax=Brevundimonas sp. TaxID=1871086 RepID=UPI0025D6AED9|nr:substrate-binding domain-containing protein [Brevundimonas sp.]